MTGEARELLQLPEGSSVVVTIGNSLRGDDGAGPYIAERLCTSERLAVFDAGTTPENYINKIIALSPACVLFIDAADFKGAAGEIRRIGRDEISDYAISTHSFPLRAVWEMIALSADAEIRLLGIQPLDVRLKEGLSDEVRRAADEIIAFLNRQSKTKNQSNTGIRQGRRCLF